MSNSDTRKRIIVAGAGTGKTTFLRNISIERFHNRHVLYLTYTISNANEFKESIVEELGYLPTNITVMTWFSFLLVHGVRPFPAKGFTHRIENLCFNEGHVKPKRGVFRGDKDYYCPKPNMIYRSRLSDLASNGKARSLIGSAPYTILFSWMRAKTLQVMIMILLPL